jgi:hypothetical protein
MGVIWKTVLAFLVTVIIAATGISITKGNADMAAASHYLEEVSAVIRESNYNKEIVNACVNEAKKNGYELQVQLMGSGQKWTKGYAKVILHYEYKLPLLGVASQKEKQKII